MLTIKYRYPTRFQVFHPDPEYFPPKPEDIFLPSKSEVPPPPDEEDDRLRDELRKIEEENRQLHRENLMLSRCMRRIQSTKLLEAFADDRSNPMDQPEDVKLPESARRPTVRKGSVHTSRPSLPVTISQRQLLAIAAYEAEQTQLEWQQMVNNADSTIEQLKVSLRMIASDEADQSRLNLDLQNYVDQYRQTIGDKEFFHPRMKVPAELVVKRINKRIHSHTTVIGLERKSIRRLHKILTRKDSHDEMDELDVEIIQTKKDNSKKAHEEVTREYIGEKWFQVGLYRRLNSYRKIIEQEDKRLDEIKKKIHSLQHIFVENQHEIDSFQRENHQIEQENSRIQRESGGIGKVPTITDYAYIIKQNQFLQQEIDIWTKRVTMVEAFLSQLRQQSTSGRFLPPIRCNSLASTEFNQ